MDKGHLIKLLNLTSSKNDGEALNATRKANAFLKENGINWEELVLVHSIYRRNDKDSATFSILNMNIRKEQANSQELEEKLEGYKNFIKFLALLIILLIVLLVLK